MSVPLDKIVSSMTDADWLQIHVVSQVNLFETKFNTQIDSQEIKDVCETVADMELPEGIDVFYAMVCLAGKVSNIHLDAMIETCYMRDLTLGLDMLVYIYGQLNWQAAYDEQLAFIFKSCIQYTIPF